MNWKTELYPHLLANPNLTALVAHRIHRTVAPEGTKAPYLVWQQITGSEGTTWDGNRNLSFPIVQFTVWSKSTMQADEIRAILRDSIEGEEIGGYKVSIRDERDTEDTSGPTLYGALLEARFHG